MDGIRRESRTRIRHHRICGRANTLGTCYQATRFATDMTWVTRSGKRPEAGTLQNRESIRTRRRDRRTSERSIPTPPSETVSGSKIWIAVCWSDDWRDGPTTPPRHGIPIDVERRAPSTEISGRVCRIRICPSGIVGSETATVGWRSAYEGESNCTGCLVGRSRRSSSCSRHDVPLATTALSRASASRNWSRSSSPTATLTS